MNYAGIELIKIDIPEKFQNCFIDHQIKEAIELRNILLEKNIILQKIHSVSYNKQQKGDKTYIVTQVDILIPDIEVSKAIQVY